jgi:filamentous hemagglutinin family protein
MSYIHPRRLISCFFISLLLNYPYFNKSVLSQVISDQTLPIPTKVTPSGKIFEITEGTSVGHNLFHSFMNFSIQQGDIVQFINNNPIIQNVFARVTGTSESNISNIDGTIQSGGLFQSFDLFLINSNGIIFGSQASLDLKGSFVATTAKAIGFGDKGNFGVSNPLTKNDLLLLTVNPSVFFFDQVRPNSILYESNGKNVTGLVVSSGENILLLGGNISFDGGALYAPNGRIELGALAKSEMVELGIDEGIFTLSYPKTTIFDDILLSNNSIIDVSDKGGGSIAVNAQNLNILSSSYIFSGINDGQLSNVSTPGKILINATQAVNIDDRSIISSSTSFRGGASGASGDVTINSDSLTLTDVSEISSLAFGRQGNSGNVTLNIANGISISGSDENSISIVASATTFGDSGNIIINSDWISLSDGAAIRNSVLKQGNTGNIFVNASKFLTVKNNSLNFTTQIRTVLEPGSTGKGGDIDIKTSSLYLTGGGQLSAAVSGPDLLRKLPGGQGVGGNININASSFVFISGIGIDGFNSGIFADSEPGAKGEAGSISISTDHFILNDQAEVKVSNLQGQAGILTINANSLILDNGKITAETGGIGINTSAANIDLNVLDILKIGNESLISTKASNQANGGNININTPILLALSPMDFEGSDIIANAEGGIGGNITINAQGVFGIEQRKATPRNQTNDIDASSKFGQSGQVQINTTTDPNQGLVELPATVVDPTTLVAQNPCRRASSSEFTRSGRGGLPPSLSQDLNGESTQVGLVEPTHLSAATPEPKSASKETSPLPLSSAKIVPAQGWVYNAKGEVVLVAYNSAVAGPQRLQSTPAGCPVF